MKHATTARNLWCACAGCALFIVGCGHRDSAKPVPAAKVTSGSTAQQVCGITAELMGVDRSKINASTSLGDLGADELDYVELVMELEDHFDIAVPDETAERLMGSDDWKQGMKNVTMAKLASLIDERRQMPRSDRAQQPRATKSTNQTKSAVPIASRGSKPREQSQVTEVKVFLNPLVILLAGTEKQKGRPLTREEVLDVRDNAAFVMMSPEQARKFYNSMDAKIPVHRMNPDRVWEEWQEIRDQVK